MKFYIYSPLLFLTLFSCNNTIKKDIDYKIDLNHHQENSDSQTLLTYFDNDSICNTLFKSINKFDGELLRWKITIIENDNSKHYIKDSSKSMSYLVKAIDSNKDQKAELAFITGKFYKAFENQETIRCQIYIYTKKDKYWIKLKAPELNEKQLNGYYGNEVVTIENNNIIRKYPIYNKNKKETGKERILTYGLNSINEFIILNEEIIEK